MSDDPAQPGNAGYPAIGVDIGGTTTIAVSLAPDGTVLGRARTPTPARAGPAAVLDAAAGLIAKVGDGAYARVGVGSAGVIDREGRVSAATSAIADWTGTDIRSELTERLNVAPVVLNDVHAFLRGEAADGAATGMSSAIGVTVGTGMGGAFLLDGRLVNGSHDTAGHVGHIPVALANEKPCPCGRRGHLETLAGGVAILEAYNTATPLAATTVAEVTQRAAAGDAVATEKLHTAGAAVGTMLAGLINAIDPAVVVLGGGVVGAGDVFLRPLRDAVDAAVLPPLTTTTIRIAALGDEAAAIGAARQAMLVGDMG